MWTFFVLGCDVEAPEDTGAFDPVTAASEAGKYTVGHRQVDVTYTEPAGEERTLRTSVWYPSHETAGAPAQYLLTQSKVALEDIAAADDAEFPVVVYSHGHQGYAEASSFLAEHLASHGYYVLAPDHTGNTTFDGGDRETSIYLDRAFDLTAVFDAFEAGELVAAPRWNGRAAVVGHSFGGYTAYASAGATYDVAAMQAACDAGTGGDVCSDWDEDWAARFEAGGADARFEGVVSMAPGDYRLFGAPGVATVGVPSLLMTGEFDPERTADGASYWEGLAPLGGRYVNILGGAHNTFDDVSGSMGDGQTIDPEVGFRIVRTFAFAFVERLFGSGTYDGILDGSEEVDGAAEVF